jgi:hypothetical protein
MTTKKPAVKKTTAPKKATASKKPTTAKKKTTTASKKPPAAKKRATAASKKINAAVKKPADAKTKSAIAQKLEALARDLENAPEEIKALSANHEAHIALLPQHFMTEILEVVNTLMDDFQTISDNNLTLEQRRRKIGAGIRNYGFMEKVADIAAANPQFAQFFDVASLRNSITNIDMCRDLVLALQSFQRAVSNTMFVYSTDAFSMSRIFYRMVQTMARQGDPTAIQLFRTLSPFFTRPKRANAEPTEKELEQHLHAMLQGKRDGKIVVENVSPVVSKGVRKVVDETSKDRAAFKEQAEGSITE